MVHVWSIYGPLLSQGSYAVSILFVLYKTGVSDKKCTAQMIVHHDSSVLPLTICCAMCIRMHPRLCSDWPVKCEKLAGWVTSSLVRCQCVKM